MRDWLRSVGGRRMQSELVLQLSNNVALVGDILGGWDCERVIGDLKRRVEHFTSTRLVFNPGDQERWRVAVIFRRWQRRTASKRRWLGTGEKGSGRLQGLTRHSGISRGAVDRHVGS
jgi:hypothetical protein